MILSILTILAGFIWLLKETQYLTVRLPYGKDKAIDYVKLLCPESSVKLLESPKYRFGDFIALEIPDLSGTLNIGCKIVRQ